MATHSSILVRRIPWTEEVGRFWSIGSQKGRHDWSDLARKYWLYHIIIHVFVPLSVQFSFSVVSNSVTPWTAAHQTSLSITNSRRLLKLTSIESVIPSNHLILCHPLPLLPSNFPSIRVFSKESVLHIRCQSIGVSASASVLPMNIHDWFPLALTSWISLLSKGLSRVFSNTTVQKHQFFSAQLSLYSNSLIHTWVLEKP